MASGELFLEPSNNVINSSAQIPQPLAGGKVFVGRQVFKKYLEFSARLYAYFMWQIPGDTLNLEPQEVVLIAENIARQSFHPDLLKTEGRVKNDIGVEFSGERCDDPQSSMSVPPGEVMNVFKRPGETSVRVALRFFSAVGLYRFKPHFQLVRKWEFVESTLLEIPILSVEDGKIQTICIGGRLGSLLKGDSIPNQPIESRSQLMNKLAEYEWQGRVPDGFTRSGIDSETGDVPPAVLVISNDGATGSLSNAIPFSLKCREVVCRSIYPAPAIFESPRTHAS